MKQNVLMFLLMVLYSISARAGAACEQAATGEGQKSSETPKFSQTDSYLDLNTGKQFKIIYDDLNETYNRDDLFALDLYVNTRTKDTFWLEDAVLVNNALRRDGSGTYKIDPMKVKRDGNGYKVISNIGQMKLNDEHGQGKPKEGSAGTL